MSRPWPILATLSAICFLSGCFVSTTPLIPAGQAVLPQDHELTLCIDGPDDCLDFTVLGDTYQIDTADGENEGTARFSPITQINGQQIYLLEAYEREDDAYIYLVARRRADSASGRADMDLALISCDDLSQDQRSNFESQGGSVRDGWGTECIAPDLAILLDTLRTVYTADFGVEAWWAQSGAD